MNKRIIAITVAAIAVGVIATVGIATAVAASAQQVSLTASVACDPTDPLSSTITWTVSNARPYEALILSVEGSAEGSTVPSPDGSVIPADDSGTPGTATFVQTVEGEAPTELLVSVGWPEDELTKTTQTVTARGLDCRQKAAVGVLKVSQPSCERSDPGGDGSFTIEAENEHVSYTVGYADETRVVVDPQQDNPVLVNNEPVTVVITPAADDGWALDDYVPDDWTVTFIPVDQC